jgi:hypothetical protein
MNVTSAHVPDPLAALTRSVGEDVTDARRLLERLETVLRRIDEKRAKLADEDGITVDVNLGAVGNAAAAARRTAEAGAVRPTFALPRGEAARARDAA